MKNLQKAVLSALIISVGSSVVALPAMPAFVSSATSAVTTAAKTATSAVIAKAKTLDKHHGRNAIVAAIGLTALGYGVNALSKKRAQAKEAAFNKDIQDRLTALNTPIIDEGVAQQQETMQMSAEDELDNKSIAKMDMIALGEAALVNAKPLSQPSFIRRHSRKIAVAAVVVAGGLVAAHKYGKLPANISSLISSTSTLVAGKASATLASVQNGLRNIYAGLPSLKFWGKSTVAAAPAVTPVETAPVAQTVVAKVPTPVVVTPKAVKPMSTAAKAKIHQAEMRTTTTYQR